MDEVQVLLAAFNGAAYLPEQLDSIFAQEGVEVSVIARDDGSTDSTLEILKSYAERFPGRIRMLPSNGRLGPRQAFTELMRESAADYIAFADQDDVWRPGKLRTLLQRLKEVESRTTPGTPVLAHCDLMVVNESLVELSPSFFRYSGINPYRNRFGDLLFRNTVTGCAVLCNRALIKRTLPIPEEAIMHDHWLAITASAYGHIAVVDEPMVLYRQHGRNSIGAVCYRDRLRAHLLRMLRKGLPPNDWPQILRQPRAFWHIHHNELPARSSLLLAALLRSPAESWIGRRWLLMRYMLGPGNFLRKVLFWIVA